MTTVPLSPFDKSTYKPLESIEPERDSFGPIEYKLKLTNVDPDRFVRLTSQLKWRLAEGGGSSLYELGVSDNGKFVGLTPKELEDSLSCLGRMCSDIRTYLRVNRCITIGDDRKVVELFITQKDLKIPDSLRTILIGPSGAGKSTAIGNFINNTLDDGAGKSRSTVLRHRQELISGKTHCLTQEIWGYSKECTKIDYSLAGINGWQQVVDASSDSVVHALDTPGRRCFQQEKLKFFMEAWIADLAILVLSPELEWREYLQFCRNQFDNMIIVINKADTCSFQRNIHAFLTHLMMYIHSWGENIHSRVIVNDEEAFLYGKGRTSMGDQHIFPIFITSLVTGDGLSQLNRFLYTRSTSKRQASGHGLLRRQGAFSTIPRGLHSVPSIDNPNVLCILSTFKNSSILCGVMHCGVLSVDTCYKLTYLHSHHHHGSGKTLKCPDLETWFVVRIMSIQIFKVFSKTLRCPQAGSLMVELCTPDGQRDECTSLQQRLQSLGLGYFAWQKL